MAQSDMGRQHKILIQAFDDEAYLKDFIERQLKNYDHIWEVYLTNWVEHAPLDQSFVQFIEQDLHQQGWLDPSDDTNLAGVEYDQAVIIRRLAERVAQEIDKQCRP